MLVGERPVANLAFELLVVMKVLIRSFLNALDAMFLPHVDDVSGYIVRVKVAHNARVFLHPCLVIGIFILDFIYVTL